MNSGIWGLKDLRIEGLGIRGLKDLGIEGFRNLGIDRIGKHPFLIPQSLNWVALRCLANLCRDIPSSSAAMVWLLFDRFIASAKRSLFA